MVNSQFIFTAIKQVVCVALSTLGVCEDKVDSTRQVIDTGNKINSKNRYFLHITDLHFDLNYEWKSRVKRKCHSDGRHYIEEEEEDATTIVKRAGRFGHRKCDCPEILLNYTMKEIHGLSVDHPIDFILWTGDNARHDKDHGLQRSRKEVDQEQARVSQMIKDAFPGIPVVPSLGNNDVYVPNYFDERNENSILVQLSDSWGQFIRGTKAKHTFLEHGYFSMNVSDYVKVVSVNTMDFYLENPKASECDIAGTPSHDQIMWIRNELKNSSNGTKVLMIGHIAPDRSMYLNSCYEAYMKIASDFAHLIRGHFYGHTNMDYFFVEYSNNSYSRADAIAAFYTSTSIAPKYNPGYRIYEYNHESSDFLIDYHQFILDLKHANSKPNLKPSYEHTYSFRTFYGVKSLSPPNLHELRESLISDKFKLIEFLKNMVSRNRKWMKRISGKSKNSHWKKKKTWKRIKKYFCDKSKKPTVSDKNNKVKSNNDFYERCKHALKSL